MTEVAMRVVAETGATARGGIPPVTALRIASAQSSACATGISIVASSSNVAGRVLATSLRDEAERAF
jgi:hypothetical protein